MFTSLFLRKTLLLRVILMWNVHFGLECHFFLFVLWDFGHCQFMH